MSKAISAPLLQLATSTTRGSHGWGALQLLLLLLLLLLRLKRHLLPRPRLPITLHTLPPPPPRVCLSQQRTPPALQQQRRAGRALR
jgi:hypothetical protein